MVGLGELLDEADERGLLGLLGRAFRTGGGGREERLGRRHPGAVLGAGADDGLSLPAIGADDGVPVAAETLARLRQLLQEVSVIHRQSGLFLEVVVVDALDLIGALRGDAEVVLDHELRQLLPVDENEGGAGIAFRIRRWRP